MKFLLEHIRNLTEAVLELVVMILENMCKRDLGTLENVVPSSEKQTSRYELFGQSSEERNQYNQKLDTYLGLFI